MSLASNVSDTARERRLNDVSCIECVRATFQILESSVTLISTVTNLNTVTETRPTCRKDKVMRVFLNLLHSTLKKFSF
jgi:hypothetical protein